MSFQIEVNEIADGWEALVKKVMKDGEEIKDERGSLTKEVMNTLVTIKKPLGQLNSLKSIRIPDGYFWYGDKLEMYCNQFIDPDMGNFKDNDKGYGTYGSRLRSHFGLDQIEKAINRLKDCNESRRSTSVTWDPSKDSKNEEVPCLILVDFKIRDNKLHTTALWRSHDLYQAWFANAVGLTYLSQYVAEELDVEVGTVTIHSISAHVYNINWEESKKYLR
jgi:thymidylate synthase